MHIEHPKRPDWKAYLLTNRTFIVTVVHKMQCNMHVQINPQHCEQTTHPKSGYNEQITHVLLLENNIHYSSRTIYITKTSQQCKQQRRDTITCSKQKRIHIFYE